jgi:hypothetical protein
MKSERRKMKHRRTSSAGHFPNLTISRTKNVRERTKKKIFESKFEITNGVTAIDYNEAVTRNERPGKSESEYGGKIHEKDSRITDGCHDVHWDDPRCLR